VELYLLALRKTIIFSKNFLKSLIEIERLVEGTGSTGSNREKGDRAGLDNYVKI